MQHFLLPKLLDHSQSTTNKMQHFSNLFISARHSTCFRWFFPPIIRSTKLHIQRQVYVRPLLLPAARIAAGSSDGLTLYMQFCAPDDGRKNLLKHFLVFC